MASFLPGRKVNSSTVSRRLVPVRIFPGYIMHFFEILYTGVTLFEVNQHVHLLQWSGKWRKRFHSMDVQTFLLLDKLVQEIMLKKSTTSKYETVRGLLASQTIGKG